MEAKINCKLFVQLVILNKNYISIIFYGKSCFLTLKY